MSRYRYIPLIKKLIFKEGLLVERALPKEGYINTSVGEVVEPSQKMGTCKVVYEVVDLGKDFKPASRKLVNAYSSKDKLIGSVHRKKFVSQFNGKLIKNEKGVYYFVSEERDYWLLPGVWGTVKEVTDKKSVLIETQAIDIHLPVTTRKRTSGELIVFPNPSEMLSFQYFNNYLKSPVGKIIYVGNTVNMDIIKRANELNVGGILAGSANKDVYDFSIRNNISLGLFSGYGEITTPEVVYQFLNGITSRYVFFSGDNNTLRIPLPKNNEFKETSELKSVMVYVKKGMKVQVFDSKNFGKTGVVDSTPKSGILVKLHDSEEVVEVNPPNLLAVE
ncbi:hypothetical protein ACFL0C_01650 [Patescibacteria group bacterium]